ncbi:hypothetical protein WDU94_011672 [Cyamophila willieti]
MSALVLTTTPTPTPTPPPSTNLPTRLLTPRVGTTTVTRRLERVMLSKEYTPLLNPTVPVESSSTLLMETVSTLSSARKVKVPMFNQPTDQPLIDQLTDQLPTLQLQSLTLQLQLLTHQLLTLHQPQLTEITRNRLV